MAKRHWTEAYATTSDGVHLTVERHDGKPACCGWDTLYAIKNDVLGKDVTVVEVFPPVDRLVNERNRRHLFVVKEGLFPAGLAGWSSSLAMQHPDWKPGA